MAKLKNMAPMPFTSSQSTGCAKFSEEVKCKWPKQCDVQKRTAFRAQDTLKWSIWNHSSIILSRSAIHLPHFAQIDPVSKEILLNNDNNIQYSFSSHSPVIFPRLWSQATVNGTADHCLSSVPRLLDKRPPDVIIQNPDDGVVMDNGNVSIKLGAYYARMNSVCRHFCTCHSDKQLVPVRFERWQPTIAARPPEIRAITASYTYIHTYINEFIMHNTVKQSSNQRLWQPLARDWVRVKN